MVLPLSNTILGLLERHTPLAILHELALNPDALFTLGVAAHELSALYHTAAGLARGGCDVEAERVLGQAQNRLGTILAASPPISPTVAAGGATKSASKKRKR